MRYSNQPWAQCKGRSDPFTEISPHAATTPRSGPLSPEDRARRVAKAEEAMDEPPGLPPVPFWARARRGAFGPGGLWLGGGTGGSVVTGPAGDD